MRETPARVFIDLLWLERSQVTVFGLQKFKEMFFYYLNLKISFLQVRIRCRELPTRERSLTILNTECKWGGF